MKASSDIRWLVASIVLATTGATWAQHDTRHTDPMNHPPAATPYAGQHTRSIKALSAQEAQDLIDGKGMGLARAAELNSYPGPMHVLELARALQLSDAQRDASMRLMHTHKEEARALGRQLVDAERELDQAFATRQIDTASLTARLQHIGMLQAAVRDAHLQTHLKQTALLTPAQVEQYDLLRGYGGDGAGTHKH